ncbi:hypothetical protein BAUCODRAFT_144098 [Baudoinia panamericana UAMH 10762]|uniref:Uncharacterized protein n=1 Tax=Baudoinia panamericana (strain UAMH 10762) TaxID=717646 RepID=M2NLQ3_BAUPA|nr:uncharacterized protein BAUCODRAFT_144098 [Baudoinia panamericana UAMH 10762]EMD00425.1 hypothetical protein BAUCODRAFT_144098 [Baudoinia panamericana UAMH 10762]
MSGYGDVTDLRKQGPTDVEEENGGAMDADEPGEVATAQNRGLTNATKKPAISEDVKVKDDTVES